MQPNDLEKIPLQVEKMFLEMQDRVMKDVVRRIRKTGGITSTADYQIQKMIMFGNSTEFVESEIKRLLNATDPEVWEIYDTVIEQDYTRNKSIYEQINRHFTPYEDNKVMQSWVKAIGEQTKDELVNITQSLGFSLLYGNKRVFTPISEYYQKYLDRACLDVVTGAFDYNTVLRRVVKEMSASGIRTVSYASGYSNRIEVAARRAVLTGVHQLSAKINEQVAKDLGTDTYEVTAHFGARPSHQEWQGGVYTKQELESICGLGSGGGLCGWNCRHSYYAFIPGISVRAYTDEQLEEIKRIDSEVKEWKGKEYNGYTATQKQRQLETTMRAQRASVKQLKNGKADAEDIQIAQAKYVQSLHEYQAFSKKMGLSEQMERVYMDGLGRIAPSDKTQIAQYTTKMLKNASRDSKQYARYKNIIGDSVGTLAEFRQMKYNDGEQFNLLSDYTNSVKNGMISKLSGFDNYKELHIKIKNEIVGTETVNGITITGQSKHFLERVIGTMQDPKTNRPRSGVDIEDIKEALLKGTVRTSIRDPNSVKYVTDKCIVSLNPQTGNLIQCNPQ